MTAKSLNAVYRKFNREYFGGRLPWYRVWITYADMRSQCWPEQHVIWISAGTSEEEMADALLHEMVHIITGGGHEDAFRGELRRIAALGCEAAARELKREEW